jgi:cytoskeletal protein CcmA (bactofilin family)
MLKYQTAPPDFYDNAIYSAGDVSSKNNAYSVIGNITYADNISYKAGNVNGTVKHDPSISPLALLSFNELRAVSQAQGNYHNSTQLNGPFPSSFWYNQAAGIPNVIFLEGNLDLNGKTSVSGFYVVGGEVTYNATLSGNVAVDGCIYTRGYFTVNGGGNALNVKGGIWAGEKATLNGGAEIEYNSTYMNAIKNMNITTNVQMSDWGDTQDPYTLVP